MLGQGLQGIVDTQGLVDLGDPLVEVGGLGWLIHRALPRGRAQLVHSEAPRNLGNPTLDRGVVAKIGETLVKAGERVLEDVLRIGGGQPVDARRDRIDVAGKALDQLCPGKIVAFATTSDELGIGTRRKRRN